MPAGNVLQSASFAEMCTISKTRREADHDPSRPKLTRAERWEFEREGTGEAASWGLTGRVDGKPDIMASGKPVKVEINTLSAHRIVHRLDL